MLTSRCELLASELNSSQQSSEAVRHCAEKSYSPRIWDRRCFSPGHFFWSPFWISSCLCPGEDDATLEYAWLRRSWLYLLLCALADAEHDAWLVSGQSPQRRSLFQNKGLFCGSGTQTSVFVPVVLTRVLPMWVAEWQRVNNTHTVSCCVLIS